MFNFVFPYAIDSVDKNITEFIIKYVLAWRETKLNVSLSYKYRKSNIYFLKKI